MQYLYNLNSPLSNVFWPKQGFLLKQATLILFGVALLAIASQLSIPLQPVPLTFQSVTVVLIGMAYGARGGASVITAYLIAGSCGLPIFADYSTGIEKLFGPTGGYLVGFLPAAWLSGYLAERGLGQKVFSSFIAALLGVSLIFLMGVSYLATFLGWDQAIALGLMPFILSEPVKLIVASFIIPHCWKKQD